MVFAGTGKYVCTMKQVCFLFLLFLLACNNDEESGSKVHRVDNTATTAGSDTARLPAGAIEDGPPKPALKAYANERFRNVTVQPLDAHRFRVSGQAQIFEARFGWVVEDGHNELAKGFESTTAGAPTWGKFSFTVTVEKDRPNTTLLLILFENSAKDGSRQHELPIPLT